MNENIEDSILKCPKCGERLCKISKRYKPIDTTKIFYCIVCSCGWDAYNIFTFEGEESIYDIE